MRQNKNQNVKRVRIYDGMALRTVRDALINIMPKNNKLLLDFVLYCQANPRLRFWQALRNWSGAANIMAAGEPGLDFEDFIELESRDNLHDTFYWTEKNEIK